MKPRVFIGSSSETKHLAYAVQTNLEQDADPTVWNQGIFELSTFTLEALTSALENFDFAVFIFTPDDIAKIRDINFQTTRDNVVFELGLFMGRLGRRRNFVILPRGITDYHLPTDLIGLTPAQFNPNREDGNWVAALGPACDQIRQALQKFDRETKTAPTPAAAPTMVESNPKVNLDLAGQVMLWTYIGNPQVQFFLALTNMGDHAISIPPFKIILRHEGGMLWEMSAEGIILRQQPVQPGQGVPEQPLLRIALSAGESWNEIVHCFQPWSEEKQDEINQLAIKVRKNIDAKFKLQPDTRAWIEVDGDLYQQSVAIFNRDFNLPPGNYMLLIAAVSDENEFLSTRGFQFTLSAEAIQQLRTAPLDGFKYGMGLAYAPNDPASMITPRLHPLDRGLIQKTFDQIKQVAKP